MAGGVLRAKRPSGVLLATLIAAGLLLLVLANTHLVYVALTSHPGCVAHPESGEAASDQEAFRAAKSAC